MRFVFSLFVFLWAAASSPAVPADPAPADTPPDVSYAELRLNLDHYWGKKIRVHGTFNYIESSGPTFEMNMGDQPVNVFINELPPESQQAVQALRPFAGTPLTVTGTARPGPAHGNAILILASKIDIEGASAHYTYDAKQGIVTYQEIDHFSQRFLHTPVTMQGRFDFREPDERVFSMWRGTDPIEVDFSRLSNEAQTQFLQEPDFSNRLLTVKGIVRPSPLRKGRYRLEATEADFCAPLAVPPLPTKPGQPPVVTYAGLLEKPAAHLNKSVQMRGSFECLSSLPSTFQMRNGSDSIEVIDEKLPTVLQNRIAILPPFSEVALRVTGTVRSYPDAPSRFYLVADRVDFLGE